MVGGEPGGTAMHTPAAARNRPRGSHPLTPAGTSTRSGWIRPRTVR